MFYYNLFDQMVKLFFKIWPFATMKISPRLSNLCQKGQNFAKYGHTESIEFQTNRPELSYWRNINVLKCAV